MKKLIALTAALSLLASCAEHTSLSVPAWDARLDAPWAAATDCWRFEPERPRIVVREDCITCQDGPCFPTASSETGYAHGETNYETYTVSLCPDLAAARHEFSHAIAYKLTGHAVKNGSGACFM